MRDSGYSNALRISYPTMPCSNKPTSRASVRGGLPRSPCRPVKGGGGQTNRWGKGEGEGVGEKVLEISHSGVFAYPEEPKLAPSWAAGVARDEKMKEKVSHRGGWMYNRY